MMGGPECSKIFTVSLYPNKMERYFPICSRLGELAILMRAIFCIHGILGRWRKKYGAHAHYVCAILRP